MRKDINIKSILDQSKIVKLLLEYGADIDAEGVDRNTPLHIAVINGTD